MAGFTNQTLDEVLYPEIEPFETHMTKVSDVHTIYWEQSGNKDGVPVLVVHGGPGAGCFPENRRYFDPAVYHIITVDQRGAGKSTPHAEIKDNTTMDLVADFEKIREELAVEKWFTYGGSWGSTLSLIYAICHPDRVRGVVVEGVFLGRQSERDWLYMEGGASNIFPDVFEKYRDHIPAEERSDMVGAYYKRLTSDDIEVRRAAARLWCLWELSTLKLFQDEKFIKMADDIDFVASLARLECHYFVNKMFVDELFILDNVGKLKGIPVDIVQGRYDVVCPTRSAWDLHKSLPHSNIVIVPDAGHFEQEVSTAREIVKITDRMKQQ